ncbi:MAG: T9SS type A sorting domain-containing protein, partial [Edaphocola sp.]
TYTSQYSLIEGNTATTNGNIDATGITVTDIFNDATNGDYTLKSSSVAINAGNNALNSTTTDLAGNARVYDTVIDLGAYEYQSETTLPVTLISFTATKKGTTALLQWQTANEVNNKGFDVERSANGKTFAKIGFTAGAGTASLPQQYQYTDPLPLTGTNYYRLKQIDADGGHAYSVVQTVTFHTATGIKVYPNPASSVVSITLAGAKGVLTITDASGKTVKTVTAAGAGTLQIDISALSPGVYFFRMDGLGGSFVKE